MLKMFAVRVAMVLFSLLGDTSPPLHYEAEVAVANVECAAGAAGEDV